MGCGASEDWWLGGTRHASGTCRDQASAAHSIHGRLLIPRGVGTRTAIVFIHGLASGPQTWDQLRALIATDEELVGKAHCEVFEYSSRLVGNRLLTRVPTYRTVADKLRTRFERYRATYDGIVFVTHSQGGLVLQTFLSRMLSAGEGEQLRMIRGIILIACPNGGSGIFLTPRRVLGTLMRHAQEERLRPLDEEIADTHRHVSLNIDRATAVGGTTCPIPIITFAAESDGIVGRASAYGSFRTHGVLPGSHTTVIRPRSHTDAGYLDLRNQLEAALARAAQAEKSATNHQRPTSPAPVRAQPAGTNLPRRSVERLIGRDVETAELIALLRIGQGNMVLIDGSAGAGKTTLALHVCHELLDQTPPPLDAVVWLSARTTLLHEEGQGPAALSASDLDDLTATIALTLDRRDLVHLPPAQRAVGVAAALSEMRSLVVLDNFETVGDPKILAYLRDLPQTCSVVITSRRRIDVPHRIHLSPLNDGHTEELVRLELSRRRLNQQTPTVARLVEMSGGIPLAVNWLVGRVALGAPHLASEVSGLNDDELLEYLFNEGLEQVSRSSGLLPLLGRVSEVGRCGEMLPAWDEAT